MNFAVRMLCLYLNYKSMKNLLLVIVALCCAQLSASAQNKKKVEGEAPFTPAKSVLKKSEAQVISQFIKEDLNNRSVILANTKELKVALKTTFGENVNITDENVVAKILKISNDEKESVAIRREALKVLYAFIPAGHILETQTTK